MAFQISAPLSLTQTESMILLPSLPKPLITLPASLAGMLRTGDASWALPVMLDAVHHTKPTPWLFKFRLVQPVLGMAGSGIQVHYEAHMLQVSPNAARPLGPGHTQMRSILHHLKAILVACSCCAQPHRQCGFLH